MKRIVCILLVICTIICGCSSSYRSPAERSIRNASEHIDLLISAAEDALDKAEESNTTIILPNDETSVLFAQYNDREHGIRQESAILADIFAGGAIDLVQVRGKTVEFSCGGAGIGSNTTYYRLIYTESGVLEDIFWYDSRMTYTDESGGYFGRLPGSDNTIFFYRITDNLYFFEAHF